MKQKLFTFFGLVLVLLTFLLGNPTKADAAITFRAAASGSTGSACGTTSWTINVPTGTVNGDVMIATIQHGNATLTPPAGWTLINSVSNTALTANLKTYYRVASSEPASYTWSLSLAVCNVGTIATYYNVAASPVDVNATVDDETSSTTHTAGAVTTTAAPETILTVFAGYTSVCGTGDTWTAPAGQTQRSNANNASCRSMAINDSSQASIGSSGTFAATVNAAGTALMSTIALKNANTAPTITINPSATYGTWTRTSASVTPWTLNFQATDAEQFGPNQLTYYVYTGANQTGTQVATGTFTSNDHSSGSQYSIAYNAPGLADGTNTLYLSVYDGALYSATNPSFTVLRDTGVPNAATGISTTPSPVTSTSYTVTFTSSDTLSTNTNELAYNIRTAAAGGGTLLTSGNATSGIAKTTASFTDSALAGGANTRYVRVCDGGSNCTDTSFTVTYSPPPTLTTTAASSLDTTKATLNGTADPLNFGAVTGYFRYAAGASLTCDDVTGTRFPSSSGSSIANGSGAVAFSQSLTGLSAGTQYAFCAYGSNVNGVGKAPSSQTFTTPTNTAGCVPPTSGSLSVSSSCYFSNQYDGVDASSALTSTANTAVLTIPAGMTLTVGPGAVPNQKIAYGSISKPGSVLVKFAGSSLVKGGVWVPDADNDGYPDTANPTYTISATQPAGYSRRASMATLATADCAPADATKAVIKTTLADADGDGYAASGGAVPTCVSPSLTPITQSTAIGAVLKTPQMTIPGVTSFYTVQATIGGTSYAYIYMGYVGGASPTSSMYKATIGANGLLGTFSTTGQTQLTTYASFANSQTGATSGTYGGTTYLYFINPHAVYGVIRAQLNSTGDVTAYSTYSFGFNLLYTAGTIYNNYIYVVGGAGGAVPPCVTGPGGSGCSTVYRAAIDGTGAVGAFSTTGQGQIPVPLGQETVATAQTGGTTYMYVFGGYNWATQVWSTAIYKAAIDASGNVGTFSSTSGSMPITSGTAIINTVTSGGTTYMYLLGGYTGASNTNKIYLANVNSSGDITSFSTTGVGAALLPSANVPYNTMTSTVAGTSYIYLMGINGNDIYKATWAPIDCNDSNASVFDGSVPLYTDSDGDGYGSGANQGLCIGTSVPAGYSTLATDCAPTDATKWQNLNGYVDSDGDGYGSGTVQSVCSGASLPAGYSTNNTDCAPTDATKWQYLTGYADTDGDGFGTSTSTQVCSGNTVASGYSGKANGDITSLGISYLPSPNNYTSIASVIVGGTTYMYSIGGANISNTALSTVYKTTLSSSGAPGAWSTTGQGQLPIGVYWERTATATIGGTSYIYMTGGNTATGTNSAVYKAIISSTGDIGAWSTTGQGQLPNGIANVFPLMRITIGGTSYLYTVGSLFYKSQLSAAGDVGTWTTYTSGGSGYSYGGAYAVVGGTTYLYQVGGQAYSSVYKATLDTNGNVVGSWSTTGQTQLPANLYANLATSLTLSGTTYMYIFGGQNQDLGQTNSTIYKAVLDVSGNIGAWSSVNQDFAYARNIGNVVTKSIGNSTYIYVIDNANNPSNFNMLKVTDFDCNTANATLWRNAYPVDSNGYSTGAMACVGNSTYLNVPEQ